MKRSNLSAGERWIGFPLTPGDRDSSGHLLARQLIRAGLEAADLTLIDSLTAQKRLAQIEKGIDILGSIFEDLDPMAEETEGRPLRAILADRLDQAATELEGDAVGDPLVVARLQDRLGQTYLGLGQGQRAEALFAKAALIRQAELGAEDPLTLGSKHNLALAYKAVGKQAEATQLLKQVQAVRQEVLGADNLDTLTTQNALAVAYRQAGNVIEAIPLLE